MIDGAQELALENHVFQITFLHKKFFAHYLASVFVRCFGSVCVCEVWVELVLGVLV